MANKLYTKLRLGIEEAAPEISVINKQLSELIPIENAIIRRIPVAERANIVSLSDVTSAIPGLIGNSSNWGLFLLNKLSKSGNVANVLNKLKIKDQKGVINTIIYGGNNKKLTPQQQKAANAIRDYLNKPKMGMIIEDVSKKGNPEARKYKSAEEFIKAQEKNVLQHASDNPNLTKFDDLTKVNKVYNDKLSEFKKLEAQRNNIKTRADIDNFDDKKWTALRDWLQSNEPPKVGGRGANAGDGIYLSSKTNLWRGAMEAEGKKLGKYDYDVLVTNPEKAKQYFQPSGGGQQLPETLIQHNEGIVLGKTGKYNLKKQLTDIWNKSQLPQEGVKQFSKSKIKSGMRDEVRSGLKSAISSLEKKMESASLPVYQKLSLKLETAKKALKRVEAKSFTIQQYHRLMEFIKLNK